MEFHHSSAAGSFPSMALSGTATFEHQRLQYPLHIAMSCAQLWRRLAWLLIKLTHWLRGISMLYSLVRMAKYVLHTLAYMKLDVFATLQEATP